jgi:Ca2+-binding RTX toxin-like protein
MTIEQFEQRRLYSVTVTEGYPGFYEIHGDEEANAIYVTVDMKNASFTLDGGGTYSNVEFIAVYGHGGDDAITLTATGGIGYIGAGVHGGDGNDNVYLGFDGAVWGDAGNDFLTLADSYRGEIYGGDGNDRMVIVGACDDAEIRGGDGNDYIDARGSYSRVFIHGDAGDDEIYGSPFDDSLYGDAGANTLYGMAGNDTFYSLGNDTVDGGDGHDILVGAGTATGVEEFYIA